MIATPDCPGCPCGELPNTVADNIGKEGKHTAEWREQEVGLENNRSRISVRHHNENNVSDSPTTGPAEGRQSAIPLEA